MLKCRARASLHSATLATSSPSSSTSLSMSPVVPLSVLFRNMWYPPKPPFPASTAATCSSVSSSDSSTSSAVSTTAPIMCNHETVMLGVEQCISEVIPGRLYVSDVTCARDEAALARLGIDVVVSVMEPTSGVSLPVYCDDDAKRQVVHHIVVPLHDAPTEPVVATAVPIVQWLLGPENAARRVLVHCHRGVSRSVTVAAVMVMLTSAAAPSMSWRDAVRVVRAARPIARPNHGFRRQLEALGRALQEQYHHHPQSATAIPSIVAADETTQTLIYGK
eukprot:PhM_4_TR7465/c0_g1_i1/m.13655/K14165/K14165; atypical dual specificity phosphatase